MSFPPVRSWLYAPGNNPKLLDRVFSAGADCVILDLEDSVPLEEKERARGLVGETIDSHQGVPGPLLFARINDPASGLAEDDIRAVVRPGLAGLRVPKVEDASSVRRVAEWVSRAESAAGIPDRTIQLVLGLESAAGVWRAADIAAAHSRVVALNLGVADYSRDLNLRLESEDGRELLYAKSHLVIASRVAGIAPPIDSVYTKIDDLEGLERETRGSRALGMFGKGAIHPRQIEIINQVFTPTEKDVAQATEIVEAAREAAARGSGAIKLPNGDFVDKPIVERAEAVLALAAKLG